MITKDELLSAITILDIYLNGEKKSHKDLISYITENIISSKKFCNLDSYDVEKIAFEYEKIYGSQTFKPGITIKDKKANDVWFYTKKNKMSEEEHAFQKRYCDFLLTQHFAKPAIDTIINDSEKVLSLCSDPSSNEKKRGLVMGDVQSGKTSNYLALASLACDYGYKCILILAGITDSLRIQTQERVDEGIIGAISSTIGNEIRYTGVGLLEENNFFAIPLTTNESDFSSISATSTSFNKPLILVVKKNKSVLTQVKKWLKPGQLGVSSHNILIIDDECDNASVNTRKDEDPSAINGLIRDIYNNFSCSTYIGFTATPFANVFINPDNSTDYSDLFPSDFIHRLSASKESYFGADKVFELNSSHLVVLNEDEDKFLPPKHKKDYLYAGLTESLRNAICDFLLCNCIRTARGDNKKHRSMMINITPYNVLQSEICNSIELYVEKLTHIISNYDKKPLDKFLRDFEMRRLYELYNNSSFYSVKHGNEDEPLNKEVPFETIKSLLFDEIAKFKVVVINNRYKGDQRFKYGDYKETGARVIAVGGYVLSRGLTLEGLMTSYFSRNSSAYDTLLQMCRWFGYRPNYEDLCRIYMSQISIDSFNAVIDAVRDLDQQLEVMEVQGKTPSDFGLMIKESPETLETKMLITARSKMRNSKEVIRSLNYSGMAIDTSKLFKDPKINESNLRKFKDFLSKLDEEGYQLERRGASNRWMYVDVEPDLLADFIKELSIPLENKKFDKENISSFIREKKYYSKWDVVFATGDEKNSGAIEFTLPNGQTIKPILRKFNVRDDENFIRISDKNNRLVEPGIFNAGLSEEEIKIAKENGKKNHPNSDAIVAKDYLDVPNRNPVLVILPIYLNAIKDGELYEKWRLIRDSFAPKSLLGFGLGFAGRQGGALMSYRINKIKMNEYQSSDEEEEEIDDD